MTSDEIFGEVERLSPDGGLVELTGGEPMLQERELSPSWQQLIGAGYAVLLETSGERPLNKVPKQVIKIVDVKCPDSGEPDTFDMENLEALESHDEVKFVLSGRGDYEFAREFVARHQLAQRVRAVLFRRPSGKKRLRRARLHRSACSTRRNWPNGCSPTMSQLAWVCSCTSLFGTRRSKAFNGQAP